VFCNAVGGQGELVFDGHRSCRSVWRARGAPIREVLVVDIGEDVGTGPIAPPFDDLDQMRLALGLGLRDYVEKNGFGDVVVGISGGIDSALTAAIAAEALGPERVHCVSMPSRFTSGGTRTDAKLVSESLGVDFREIPIEPVVEAFENALAPSFERRARDTTEENIRRRRPGARC
jgi:hypothetical protein